MLLDHFHSPLADRRGWKGFHTQWATGLAADLNSRLPEGWWAETEVRFGIEVDVGVLEESGEWSGASTAAEVWLPPEPVLTVECALATHVAEVKVLNTSYSPSLVAAIELVSPANKDRPEQRDAFVSKCATILNQGAGLIVVDVVTERRANLHGALLEHISADAAAISSNLYATAYHSTRGDDETHSRVRIWYESLEVGRPLPVLPLFLRIGPMMPIDLDATYRRACRELRIPVPETVDQR